MRAVANANPRSSRKRDILAGGHLMFMTRAGPLDTMDFIGDQERYEDLIDASSKVSMASGSIRVCIWRSRSDRKKQLADRRTER